MVKSRAGQKQYPEAKAGREKLTLDFGKSGPYKPALLSIAKDLGFRSISEWLVWMAQNPVEKWCRIVRPYDDAPDVDHLLRAFWAILEGALKHNDGAPLWANSTTTAFEALAELAHDYAPDVAREFQERLDSDW